MKNLPREYVSLLKKYISFKSISTDINFNKEIQKTHKWLVGVLEKEGFKTKLLKYKKTNPIVYAEHIHNKNTETILVYGHYDVQPASIKDWKYDPFKLRITKNKLIARGATDNKGQLTIHISFIKGLPDSSFPSIKSFILYLSLFSLMSLKSVYK